MDQLFWQNLPKYKLTLEQAIRQAAEVYRSKFGFTPTVCYCHASVKNGTEQVRGIQVRVSKLAAYPSWLYLVREDWQKVVAREERKSG